MTTTDKGVTYQGKHLTILGHHVGVGDMAPGFRLVEQDLTDITLGTFSDRPLVLSVVPSIDTSTCALQTRCLTNITKQYGGRVTVLTISLDLPFAQTRWRDAQGSQEMRFASDYKYRTFGLGYGVYIEELGLLARAVFVVSANGHIEHAEYVSDLSHEPNYQRLNEVLSKTPQAQRSVSA